MRPFHWRWLPWLSLPVFAAVLFLFEPFAHTQTPSYSEQELGPEEVDDAPLFLDPYADWKRPDGPLRVGIQVGHWKTQEAPDELENLRDNTGASAGGFTEWETNLAIAKSLKTILEAEGIAVDLLPVAIPPGYWADVFLSIHADGNLDTSIAGYKVAAPRRDRTGKAQALADLISQSYGEFTSLALDPNITRNMTGYYAFNWRRYEHSIHPMTVAAIVETGFLTNASDRNLIAKQPERSAQAIAKGVMKFLEAHPPITSKDT